jgi:D-3-phosphoglycerate dehydrogenase / 2-oxoglutarate reductase
MPDLSRFYVVRLNQIISPVDDFELGLYRKFRLEPTLAEANRAEDQISLLRTCDAVMVVSSALPAPVIDQMENCRVICRLGIGVDKIDVEKATQRGILVTNVPGCFSEEMAEHTMAMILGLARKLPQMASALREGAWRRSRQLSIQNQRLSNSVLGLVGFGDSAQRVARLARAFGMQIIATRRNWQSNSSSAEELGVRIVDLDTLLKEADFVSLHLPLNPQTYHLIDASAIRKMKATACLINTARGAIVDEAALVCALQEGRLGGAGLDTFESINPFTEQEIPPQHPLLEMENVILSPHVSALSVQGMQAVARGGIHNLVAVLSGYWPPPNQVVNPGVSPRYPLSDNSLSTVNY